MRRHESLKLLALRPERLQKCRTGGQVNTTNAHPRMTGIAYCWQWPVRSSRRIRTARDKSILVYLPWSTHLDMPHSRGSQCYGGSKSSLPVNRHLASSPRLAPSILVYACYCSKAAASICEREKFPGRLSLRMFEGWTTRRNQNSHKEICQVSHVRRGA